MPVIIDGTSGVTTPTYGGADTSEYLVPVTQFKNRIINGAMTIDQRNAGASVNPTDGQYIVDRWYIQRSQASKLTAQQNAGSVTPPAGFINYLGITSSSAYSVGTNDYFALAQAIEGFNVADLGFGTANAKTVTISFWVYSSLTGTFGASLSNGAESRSYPFTYTISSANTWTQITQTIAGDTTGTYATGNTAGMKLFFGLGAGSTYAKTAGSWQAGTAYTATGATSVVGTNGATFYITGVQLEVGSTATSFDYRPYGTELQLCQRYFEKSQQNAAGLGANTIYTSSVSDQSNNAVYSWKFAVEKRTTPTMTAYTQSGTAGSWDYGRSGASSTATVTFHQGMTSVANMYMNIGAAWTGCNIYGNLVASAEL